ncbi:winged helix-turn-helix domain-containing protein [Pantoea sp. SOD02]|uniref:winged helix-turn-helix domain-containing protein n=1 Tax=Pantoea sp. SOD02 TaxID=2970818 RepID=UPI0021573868|nr:winged helix-turn-helix domain-containing protein [Pantoea sp. SOD02]UVC31653.1 winged helix-turn-helix domain-containing protein [Pantoea sp. SOD02]
MSVIFDMEHRQLINDEIIIELSRQQTECLSLLVSAKGNIVSRKEIMDCCWADRGLIVSDSSVRVALYQLRKQLAAAGVSEGALVTEVGSGYRLRNGYLELPGMQHIDDAVESTALNGDEITLVQPLTIPSTRGSRSMMRAELLLFILCMVSLTLLAGWLHMKSLLYPVHYVTLHEQDNLHILVQKGMRANAEDIKNRFLSIEKVNPYSFSTAWIYVNRSILQHGNLSTLVCDREITQLEKLCYSLNFQEGE